MTGLFIFIILSLPILVELYRDRNGDAHPNSDWKSRTWMTLIVGLACTLILDADTVKQFFIDWLRFTIISGGLFVFLFNYLVNFVHLKRGVTTGLVSWGKLRYPHILMNRKEVILHVLSHLSDKAWPDKTKWWRWLGWRGRLVVNFLGLVGSVWVATLLG